MRGWREGGERSLIDWHPWEETPLEGTTWVSPLGAMWITWRGQALVAGEFGQVLPRQVMACRVNRAPLPAEIRHIYEAAFSGETPTLAVSALGLTALERAILSTATEIPFGSTASYGTVAHWAGFPGRARAAGRAMSRAPLVYVIPTHRVIRADGSAAACQRDPVNDALRHYEHIHLGRRAGG